MVLGNFQCRSVLLLLHKVGQGQQVLDGWPIFLYLCPPTKGEGDVVFGAEPVGISISMTLSCLHDLVNMRWDAEGWGEF